MKSTSCVVSIRAVADPEIMKAVASARRPVTYVGHDAHAGILPQSTSQRKRSGSI